MPEESASHLISAMKKIGVEIMSDFKSTRKPELINNGRGSFSVFFNEEFGGYRELRDINVITEKAAANKQELFLSYYESGISVDPAIDLASDVTKIVDLSKLKNKVLLDSYTYIAKLAREHGKLEQDTKIFTQHVIHKVACDVVIFPEYKTNCWIE